ncbi:ABC transporter permease [Paenibacillus antri]|uniref:ABC transporter permease n=1 Tax=Paenibacillus antri TaxID=2582848 RepID=A0A5R9GA33_9BACL|nr:FtsX-like permease family protein [Paenibacillus antri]TLS50940.1 ABC transporter permease [Paenibacillus antri]
MKFSDQLAFVRQNAKKNKSRLYMTVLATAMGCAFLIVLASVGFGLQKSIVDEIVNDRLVTAIDVWGKEDVGNEPLTDADMDYLRSVEHVETVTFRHYLQQSLTPKVDGTDLSEEGVQAIAVDFAQEGKAGFKLHAGRLPQAANEVVIGYSLKETNPEEWIGKTMELQALQYEGEKEALTPLTATIVGVKAAPTKEWEAERSIFMGLDLLDEIERITGTRLAGVLDPKLSEEELGWVTPIAEPRPYQSVQVIAESAERVKGIAETIREAGYYNHSIANELEQVNVMFLIMKIGLGFVGTIAVLIASIGIYNTMTMAVTERAQDIGIMKAIGAHPSTIRRLFLLESGWIGILGAVIGAVVAYGISIGVNAAMPIVIETFMEETLPEGFVFSLIPASLTAFACFVSLAVAMLSGAGPARRATRIDVLRALRRDL